MDAVAQDLRLGHAFPNPKESDEGWVEWAYTLLRGDAQLEARAPTDSIAVQTAEDWLGISPDRRPVYAYVGCLHPALGRIALVLYPTWLDRDPHGVTRCDSGGLAGRFGGFEAIPVDECPVALKELTLSGTEDWRGELDTEIEQAYEHGHAGYVQGHQPDPGPLDGHRCRCIEHAERENIADARRLWTWEARSFAAATAEDVHALVLANEAFKEFDQLRRDNGDIPEHVEVIQGCVHAEAVEYFREERVHAVLLGGVE